MADAIGRLTAALQGRYRIERELGAGGMATVYLARDIRHDRDVAIKVLKPELAAVLGADRFVQEIRTTAQLQHPNILPLFESGEADGFLFYVMPYVEGETLRDRIDREKQLPIDEAVRMTSEVAGALDYAHRHGVIHRDIKPENILLHDGRPLVSDFGIALALSAAAGSRMTETGLSIGTPHYMSPEQATAEKDITSRSDIYSLGAVLYEMLTGDPPHTGASAQQIVMKIVTEEPAPVSRLRRSVPPNVAAALATSLEKLPADRFVSASAFAAALSNPAFRGAAATAAAGSRRRRWPALVGAAFAAGTLLGVLAGRMIPPAPTRSVTRFAISLPDSESVARGAGVNLAWTPDGSGLVYVGGAPRGGVQLWERRLDALDSRPIPGTLGAHTPAISPDGRFVAFTTEGALKSVPLEGGPPITLVATGVPATAGGVAWSEDGRIYFSANDGGIHSVPAGGGPQDTLTVAEPGTQHRWVEALPGGRGFLLTVARGVMLGESRIEVVAPRGRIHAILVGAMARYSPSGHILYTTADGTLMAVRFDARRLAVTGAPVPLLEGVDVYGGSGSQFALSRNGNLAWLGGGAHDAVVVRVDRHGAGGPIDPTWTGDFQSLALSPDGSRLAVSISTNAGQDLWIKELDRGPLSRFSFEGTRNGMPAWSPDGRSVAFVSNRSGSDQVWIARGDGTGAATLPLRLKLPAFDATWTPDGKELVAGVSGGKAGTRLVAFRPGADTAARPLVPGGAISVYPAVSPDGRWLAYASNESGALGVFVRPFPRTDGGRWEVSPGGGNAPIWAHSGREIFYVSPVGALMAVDVGTDRSGAFRHGTPHALFPADLPAARAAALYDVAPDDQHFFLVRRPGASRPSLVVAENFVQELRARVPR